MTNETFHDHTHCLVRLVEELLTSCDAPDVLVPDDDPLLDWLADGGADGAHGCH